MVLLRAAALVVVMLMLLVPPGVHAIQTPQGVSVIQSCSASAEYKTPIRCGLANQVTAGDILVVEASTTASPRIDDGYGRTFKLIASGAVPTTSYTFSVYYAYVTVSDFEEITLNGNSSSPRLIVDEISGAVGIQNQAVAVNASSTVASVPSYAPTLGGLVLAAIDSSSNQETFAAGQGYTLQTSVGGNMADESLSPATGSTTSPFVMGSASSSVEISVAFTASAPPLLTLDLQPSGASQTNIPGAGVGVTITYTGATSTPLSFFAYFSLVNPAGQTVSVVRAANGAPLNQNQSETFLFGLGGVKSGTYTAYLFASTLQGAVVSGVTTVTVTF
jgi:hypothetical protein